MQASLTRPEKSRPSYGLIFLGLLVLTAIELGLSVLRVMPPLSTVLYLLFSGMKVALVAAYFMHLREDSRLYTAIFVLPALLLLVFALLTIAI
jgi:caa(3)-type oxidase subunit IV